MHWNSTCHYLDLYNFFKFDKLRDFKTNLKQDFFSSSFNAKFNKEITIEASVDASLVGGAIIRAGDIVIDGSVKGRLAKLVDTLVQA